MLFNVFTFMYLACGPPAQAPVFTALAGFRISGQSHSLRKQNKLQILSDVTGVGTVEVLKAFCLLGKTVSARSETGGPVIWPQ